MDLANLAAKLQPSPRIKDTRASTRRNWSRCATITWSRTSCGSSVAKPQIQTSSPITSWENWKDSWAQPNVTCGVSCPRCRLQDHKGEFCMQFTMGTQLAIDMQELTHLLVVQNVSMRRVSFRTPQEARAPSWHDRAAKRRLVEFVLNVAAARELQHQSAPSKQWSMKDEHRDGSRSARDH